MTHVSDTKTDIPTTVISSFKMTKFMSVTISTFFSLLFHLAIGPIRCPKIFRLDDKISIETASANSVESDLIIEKQSKQIAIKSHMAQSLLMACRQQKQFMIVEMNLK